MLTKMVMGESGYFVEMPVPLPARLTVNGLARDIVWPEISRDLVEVAYAVLLTDRLILRPLGTLGPRQIHLRLPVRKPRVWKRVADNLQDVLAILGGDTFTFEFYGRRSGSELLSFPNPARSLQLPHTERVALFSGGLDSASAAAIFAKQTERVAYVTHYVRGINHIESLLARIQQAYGPSAAVPHAQFYIRPGGPLTQKLKENSRRSRPFLYVSLALAIAAAISATEVCVCENGVLALNLPLTPTMIPTRHAHSQFLSAMERLAERLFGARLRVTNPFELMTKGEMTRIFAPNPELALLTASCWYQQWAGRGRNYGKGHCGSCVPCLVRFASLRAAGIAIPKGHFDLDVRRLRAKSRLSSDEARHLVPYLALSDFAARVQGCRSWQQFLVEFPQVIESEPTSQVMDPNKWYKSLFHLMTRFSLEVEQAFPDQ